MGPPAFRWILCAEHRVGERQLFVDGRHAHTVESSAGTGNVGVGGMASAGSAGAPTAGAAPTQCAIACGPTQTCINGSCSCPAPQQACGHACANVASDAAALTLSGNFNAF